MPATSRPSTTDRALIDALAAWGGVEALPLLRRLGVQRAGALAGVVAATPPAEEAIRRLREARTAQFAPDPARVHPSWFVRALQDESPAVRRAVVEGTSGPLRSRLISGLGLAPDDLTPDHPADPGALEVVQALWTERLVGDLPPRHDDPPAIRAMTTLGPAALFRLVRLCGLAKRALMVEASDDSLHPRDAERLTTFRDQLSGPVDPRLAKLVANDWSATDPQGRRRLEGLGLATIGRRLARADPYRVRWALQHVPYPVAKALRIAASRPEASVRAVQALETRLLAAAWARLEEEGRLP